MKQTTFRVMSNNPKNKVLHVVALTEVDARVKAMIEWYGIESDDVCPNGPHYGYGLMVSELPEGVHV